MDDPSLAPSICRRAVRLPPQRFFLADTLSESLEADRAVPQQLQARVPVPQQAPEVSAEAVEAAVPASLPGPAGALAVWADRTAEPVVQYWRKDVVPPLWVG
jgi:hypothetical protein